MDRDLDYGRVLETVRARGGKLLRDARLFDVYTGENIEPNRKSLALALILQDYSETLTDERVDRLCRGILDGLAEELDISLRD